MVETKSLTERVRDIRRRDNARDAGTTSERCFPRPHGWCETLFSSANALRNHVAIEHTRGLHKPYDTRIADIAEVERLGARRGNGSGNEYF